MTLQIAQTRRQTPSKMAAWASTMQRSQANQSANELLHQSMDNRKAAAAAATSRARGVAKEGIGQTAQRKATTITYRAAHMTR